MACPVIAAPASDARKTRWSAALASPTAAISLTARPPALVMAVTVSFAAEAAAGAGDDRHLPGQAQLTHA